MKGLILAAGYGTRFLPATKTLPKELFPLVDRPAIHFLVEEFIASGITEILIITSRRKKALEDYFDREIELEETFRREGRDDRLALIAPPRAKISFIRQQAMRGTGDALLLAREFAGGDPLCVAYPDDLVFGETPLAAQLAACLTAEVGTVLAVMDVPDDERGRYGIVTADASMRVSSIIEKPRPGQTTSNLALIGRYFLAPEAFPLLEEERRKHPNGEYYQIDPVNTLAAAGKVAACRFHGLRLDVGEPLGYLAALVEYALRRDDLAVPFRTFLEKRLAIGGS
jgi:UTP--glucose-1-phosphate uridylyltransferase